MRTRHLALVVSICVMLGAAAPAGADQRQAGDAIPGRYIVMAEQGHDAAGEDFQKTVELIQEQLTDENMQELNARVDLDKKDPATVAEEYLTETGLIGG